MANALRKDRYTPTVFQEELARLQLSDNGLYEWLPDGCQAVAVCLPQDRLGKDRIVEDRLGKDKKEKQAKEKSEPETESAAPESEPPMLTHPESKESKHIYGEYKHVRLTDSELDKLKAEYGTAKAEACITFLDEYIEMKGYKAKNHYLCIRKWVHDAVEQKTARGNPVNKTADDLNNYYRMLDTWSSGGVADG